MGMERVIEFLSEIRVNNNKHWFDEHKSLYKQALEEFDAFAEELIDLTGRFDESVRGLGLKDCTYRIYRDLRFSPNKEPYKTHMGIFISPHGKKSGYAGYYFHIEPQSEHYEGNNLFSCGLYMPEPAVLKSVREEMLDNGAAMMRAVERADGFVLDQSSKLKRTPVGFPTGTEADELLKLKDVMLDKYVDNAYLAAPSLADRVASDFEKTSEFIKILNRAVQYAHEEMM